MKRTTQLIQTVCILLFLQAQLPRPVNASAHAFKGAAIANLCKLTGFLAKLPGDAIDRLQTEARAITAATETQAMANAAAAAADSETKVVFQAAAAAAAECAADTVAGLTSKETAVVSATGRAAKEIGHIAELVNYLKQVSAGGGSTGYCLTKAADEANAADESEQELKCDKQTIVYNAQAMQYTANDVTDDGFPVVPGGDAKSGTATNKCKLFHKGSAAAAASDLFQKPGQRSFIGGLLTVTTVGSSQPGSLTISGQSTIATAGAAEPNQILGELYNSVQELKNIQGRDCGTDEKSSISKVIEDEKVKALLTAALAIGATSTDKESPEQRAQKMLERVAGTTSELGTAIFKKIEEQQAMHTESGKATQKQLRQIIGADNHRLTLQNHTVMAQNNLGDLKKKIEDLTGQTAVARKKRQPKKTARNTLSKDPARKRVANLMAAKKMVKSAFQTLKQKQTRKVKEMMEKQAQLLFAQGKTRRHATALRAANAREKNAKIPLFFSIRNSPSLLILLFTWWHFNLFSNLRISAQFYEIYKTV
uniref:Variant surface glycoprotein 1125.4873 n=1 Tax=Trypanosoma brucei TaxID=5691 RepID=A0A1J0RB48_9TRYP|nr:variant surface glycoprotein 1125.4873 [Trypanosoma brucei]